MSLSNIFLYLITKLFIRLIHATFSANLGGYMKTATDAILTIETVMLKSRNLKRDVELRYYFLTLSPIGQHCHSY